MKLTHKTEYAILALVYLARVGEAQTEVIAHECEIPFKFLQQILRELRLKQLVIAIRGPKGGFRLKKSANKITLAEIVRLFDGALAPTKTVSVYYYEPGPLEAEPKAIKVFKEIRDFVSKKLEKTTIEDLI